jgi:hypothetical protein
MSEREQKFRRGDARSSTRRDVERFRRRAGGEPFQRSLALIGSAGWPIVLLATGGALLGRYLDARLDTGIRLTLLLLTLGTSLGCVAAYRSLKGGHGP